MKNNFIFLGFISLACLASCQKKHDHVGDPVKRHDPVLWALRNPSATFEGAIEKVDLKTGTVLQTIPLKTDPNFEDGLAYDGKLLYYINGRTDAVGLNKVIRIDPSGKLPNDTFPTVFPPRMDGLGIDKKDLYVLDFLNKKILVVNTDTKQITRTVTPGFKADAIGGISFGGNRGTLFVSSFVFGDSTTFKIYEINSQTGATVDSIRVASYPFGLAYSESAHAIYYTCGEFFDPNKATYAVNPDSKKIIRQFPGSGSALAADESSK